MARGGKISPPPLPSPSSREKQSRGSFGKRWRLVFDESYPPVVYDVNVYAGASPVCRAITGRKLAAKLLVRKPDTQARYIWRRGCRVGGRVFRGKNREEKKLFESRFVGVWPRSNAKWIQRKFFFPFSFRCILFPQNSLENSLNYDSNLPRMVRMESNR